MAEKQHLALPSPPRSSAGVTHNLDQPQSLQSEATPRRLLKGFPSLPVVQLENLTNAPGSSVATGPPHIQSSPPPRQQQSGPTPRKIFREYPAQSPVAPLPVPSADIHATDPTPRKLIKGLLSSQDTTSRGTNSSHYLQAAVSSDPSKALIRGFPSREQPQEHSFSDSRDWTSEEDAQFNAKSHIDLLSCHSFQECRPQIIDGTLTLGLPLDNSSTPKDLIKGFSRAENGIHSDSRDWPTLEDVVFNRESHQELLTKTSFRDCFPRIVDGTFSLGLTPDPTLDPLSPAPLLRAAAIAGEAATVICTEDLHLDIDIATDETATAATDSGASSLHSHGHWKGNGDESRFYEDLNASRQSEESLNLHALCPPLPLPQHSPSPVAHKRYSPSPALSTRQRKSLVIITQPVDLSGPHGSSSHPATPIEGTAASSGSSTRSSRSPSISLSLPASMSIPWATSSDSLHLSSADNNDISLEDPQRPSSSAPSSSGSDGDSSSSGDSSDSEEEDEGTDADTTLNSEGGPPLLSFPSPLLPPPPLTSTAYGSGSVAHLDPPLPPPLGSAPPLAFVSSSAASPPPFSVPTLPQGLPLVPYKRSSSYGQHMAFLDLVEILLHLLNCLLLLLVLLSLLACLLLVYLRHQLLSSEEETISMFGIEISPAMIAL